MPQVEKEELLLASLNRQFFFSKGNRLDIVSALCGLQAQFANNPGHALRIRAHDFHPDEWRRDLIKTWTFRHTLHAIRRDEASLFLSAQGIPETWDDRWGIHRRHKPKWTARLHEWIRSGITGREQLKAKCRERGMSAKMMESVFHGWGGLLKEMSRRGLVAYQPGTGKHFVALDDFVPMDRDAARSILMERYFRNLGPATLQDYAVFSGLNMKTVLALLHKHPLPLKSVHCGGVEYLYLGEWDVSRSIPPCLFLAGFDQLILAYRDRSRLLDDIHKPDVVTNTGIIHPTVLIDGRLKAKWKKDGGVLRITPFAKLTKTARKRIAAFGGKLFGKDVSEVCFSDDS